MAVSLKAVHCISGRKKVFPQTFLSELSWVMSKCKDFSFCKYFKIIFLELITIIAGKRLNLSVPMTENFLNWQARCSKTTKRNKNCYYPYIKWSFKGKKCTLLLIYFVLGDPENVSITTRYITFWKPAKVACLRWRLFPKSRPCRSKLQLNSAKQGLGSIEM